MGISDLSRSLDFLAGVLNGNQLAQMSIASPYPGPHSHLLCHTLKNIGVSIRELFEAEQEAQNALTDLAGYMVLDALIGNTDRHHENWALLETTAQTVQRRVAPSFDHASSLGRELLDIKRAQILSANRIHAYISKGTGGIFRRSEDRSGANPLRLVEIAARAYPALFRSALKDVAALTREKIEAIVDAVPEERASVIAKQFAIAMILDAQTSLKEIKR